MLDQSQAKDPDKRVAFLRDVPLFSGLSDIYLTTLTDNFRARQYRKGDTIFHQGDQSRELYVVMKGKVRIFHLAPNGDETTVNILASRQIIGEFAIIDGMPRSATAKASTACTLLEMSQERLHYFLETMPGLALSMCHLLVGKVRWTSNYAETISRFDAAGRLLHFLLSYNETIGEEIEPNKQYVINLGLNQTDLASLVGARRQWVNHILQDWRKRNLVAFDARVITILDLPAVIAERDSRIEMPSSW